MEPFFPESDGPRYLMAMLLMMAFWTLSIMCSLGMKFRLTRANDETSRGRVPDSGDADGSARRQCNAVMGHEDPQVGIRAPKSTSAVVIVPAVRPGAS